MTNVESLFYSINLFHFTILHSILFCYYRSGLNPSVKSLSHFAAYIGVTVLTFAALLQLLNCPATRASETTEIACHEHLLHAGVNTILVPHRHIISILFLVQCRHFSRSRWPHGTVVSNNVPRARCARSLAGSLFTLFRGLAALPL